MSTEITATDLTPPTDGAYLTLSEAADMLNVSIPTVRRALRERGLPLFKEIGIRNSLVRATDVEALRGAVVRVQSWPVHEEE